MKILLVFAIVIMAAAALPHQEANSRSIHDKPRDIPVVAAGGGLAAAACYILYDVLLKRRLQPVFLTMKVLAPAIAVDNSSTSEILSTLLSDKTTPIQKLGQDDISNIQESADLIWEGTIAAITKDDNGSGAALKNEWYTTAKKRKNCVIIHVAAAAANDENQNKVSLYVPKALFAKPKDRSISSLLAKRKSRSVIHDVHDKIAWQNFVKQTILIQDKAITIQPGRYRFVYRENVNMEDWIGMIANGRGITKLGFAQDSILVLEEDGHCYLEDYFVKYGILPLQTHNTGEWTIPQLQQDSSSPSKISWDKNSVRIGWGKGMFGRIKEMEMITKLLRAAPWELRPCRFGNDDSEKEGLLLHRPGAGWMVWERIE